MPLGERVRIANEIAAKNNGRAIYVSVHGNAGGGTGFEVYTSKGQTKSDKIAGFYMDAMAEEFPGGEAIANHPLILLGRNPSLIAIILNVPVS